MSTSVPSIRVRGLTRRFGSLVAVDGIDLDLPARGVIGFVGPNGAGKSTTIRMLLGLIAPSEGQGEILGEPMEHPQRHADRVGALVESPAFLPNISARANVASMALLRGVPMERVDIVLRQVGLAERADDRVAKYSLGMKQRLAIAIALLSDPDLLVLDEPTNGLDPAGVVEVRELIRSLADHGRAVLVSSHLLSEIQAAADYVVVIRDGKLLFTGPLEELLRQEQRFVGLQTEHPADLSRLEAGLRGAGFEVEPENDGLRVLCDPELSPDLYRVAVAHGVALRRLQPRHETLEDIFLRMTDGPAHQRAPESS